jgi:hypothetical protein
MGPVDMSGTGGANFGGASNGTTFDPNVATSPKPQNPKNIKKYKYLKYR